MFRVNHPLAPDIPRSAIDEVLPTFDIRERHELAIAATPLEVDAALRTVDLLRSPAIRALFAVRGIHGEDQDSGVMTLDDLRRFLGFAVRVDKPGEELVLAGEAAEQGSGVLARLDLAWGFRIEPSPDGGSLASTETRVRAHDAAARRAFLRYWTVVGPFSALIRRRLLALVAAQATRRPS